MRVSNTVIASSRMRIQGNDPIRLSILRAWSLGKQKPDLELAQIYVFQLDGVGNDSHKIIFTVVF